MGSSLLFLIRVIKRNKFYLDPFSYFKYTHLMKCFIYEMNRIFKVEEVSLSYLYLCVNLLWKIKRTFYTIHCILLDLFWLLFQEVSILFWSGLSWFKQSSLNLDNFPLKYSKVNLHNLLHQPRILNNLEVGFHIFF